MGSWAHAGMLFGACVGGVVLPGLDHVVGRIAESKSLSIDEEERSMTEEVARDSVEEVTHHA